MTADIGKGTQKNLNGLGRRRGNLGRRGFLRLSDTGNPFLRRFGNEYAGQRDFAAQLKRFETFVSLGTFQSRRKNGIGRLQNQGLSSRAFNQIHQAGFQMDEHAIKVFRSVQQRFQVSRDWQRRFAMPRN